MAATISAAAAPGLRRSLAAQAPAASFFSSQPAKAVVSPAQHRVGEYGLGGRHSVSGVRCALFGGIGFIGRYVCSEMGKIGTRVRVGNRGCELEARHLKVSFDHGQFHAPFYSVRDEASIAEVIGRANVVVNMVGKYYETRNVVPTRRADGGYSNVNYSYEEVNVDAARAIARQAKAAGAQGFVHVSAMAADANSPSEWARTKAAGEKAVLEEFPEATIVRPCALFGWEDRLLNWFAGIAGMPGALVPLVDDGASVLQPVYAVDVAKVINKITLDPAKYAGKVVELGGPAEYTRRELAEFTFDVTKQQATLVPVPAQLADFAAGVMNLAPSPMWTRDEVALETVDVVVPPGTPNLTFADFGIAPTPIEKIAFSYLHRYREGGHFIIAKGYHG